jgi:hypothetical protein
MNDNKTESTEQDPQNLTPEQQIHAMKALAVRQAMTEFVAENRSEIIARARAKLTAQGIAITDEESTDNV